MELTSEWESGYRCRVSVRDFTILTDEPEAVGGTDQGPMPTELFLASLASCFTMAVAHTARKRGIDLADLSVDAEATYDGLRLDRIRLTVRSSYPRDKLEALLTPASRVCYVSNTLRAGPKVEYTVG